MTETVSREPWVGTRQVLTHLGISRATLGRWISKGVIPPPQKPRGLYGPSRFRLSVVDAAMERHAYGAD